MLLRRQGVGREHPTKSYHIRSKSACLVKVESFAGCPCRRPTTQGSPRHPPSPSLLLCGRPLGRRWRAGLTEPGSGASPADLPHLLKRHNGTTGHCGRQRGCIRRAEGAAAAAALRRRRRHHLQRPRLGSVDWIGRGFAPDLQGGGCWRRLWGGTSFLRPTTSRRDRTARPKSRASAGVSPRAACRSCI